MNGQCRCESRFDRGRGSGERRAKGRASRLAWGVVVLLFVAGCGQDDGLERAAVKGRVTVAGQPLARGRILFRPLSPTQGPTVSAAVTDGGYEIVEKDGPVVGRQRVEVEAELPLGFALDDESAFAKMNGRPLPPNPIPPAFNTQSLLVAEIESGENSYDVTVPAARTR